MRFLRLCVASLSSNIVGRSLAPISGRPLAPKGYSRALSGGNGRLNSDKMGDSGEQFTTNAQDLEEAANLQARLSERDAQQAQTAATSGDEANRDVIPSVSLDSGAYKYVLITAKPPSSNDARMFVYSKRGADYHRNVAEYLLPQLEAGGYHEIRITGGGRILRDDTDRRIHIYGYSYGFGKADHAMAKKIVERSGSFTGYQVTWSNDGY